MQPKEPVLLWTYAQISELTGMEQGTLRVWRTRGKLPTPDYVIGEGEGNRSDPAWKPETVRQWWETFSE